jgi:hypothetical protein
MFVVEWEFTATEDFAALTALHPGRWNDINAANNDIERKLRKNPLQFSLPVSEGLRRIISDPLAIFFSIEGNNVYVQAVGWID